METITGIYEFDVGDHDFGSINFFNCKPANTGGVLVDIKHLSNSELVGGKWNACLMPNGVFMFCTKEIMNDFKNIYEFYDFMNQDQFVESMEDMAKTQNMFKTLKKNSDISTKMIATVGVKNIAQDEDTQFIEFNINKDGDCHVDTDKCNRILDMMKNSLFPPKMAKLEEGSYFINLEWPKTNASVLTNSFNDICGFMFNESSVMQEGIIPDYDEDEENYDDDDEDFFDGEGPDGGDLQGFIGSLM